MGRPRFIRLLARLHILFARAASMLTAGAKICLASARNTPAQILGDIAVRDYDVTLGH